MKEQYKRLFNMVADIFLMLIQLLLFAWTWYTYYESGNGFSYFRRGSWAIIGMYMLIIFFFTKTFGGYKVGYLRITEVCMSQIVALFCANFVEYFQLCIVSHRYISVTPLLALLTIQIAIVIPWAYFFRRIYITLYPPRNMIFIYGERAQNELIQKINLREDKYKISQAINISVGLDKIYQEIVRYDAVIIGDIPAAQRNDILKSCFSKSVRAYVTPKISDILVTGSEEIHLFDTPLLLSRNNGLSGEQLIVKRIEDILISVGLLTILSPFMLLTALCIKLYDRGPVFYKQERLTRDRKPFLILKFRSMIINSEKNGARLAMKNDDRVTPIGKFIRRIHFDEIPQLINILKGDMSFVGPRPERDSIAKEYEAKIPEFSFRLRVKAGLTGYAQVYGKYNTTPYDKLKLDLTYIEKYSLWLDIKIILMTVKTIFQKDNTEGIDSNQLTAIKRELDDTVLGNNNEG